MKTETMNDLLKIAGMPLMETAGPAETADKDHERKEHDLFKKSCEDLTKVVAMCEDRLKSELTDEHKKQYTALLVCSKQCCMDMNKHLETYK